MCCTLIQSLRGGLRWSTIGATMMMIVACGGGGGGGGGGVEQRGIESGYDFNVFKDAIYRMVTDKIVPELPLGQFDGIVVKIGAGTATVSGSTAGDSGGDGDHVWRWGQAGLQIDFDNCVEEQREKNDEGGLYVESTTISGHMRYESSFSSDQYGSGYYDSSADFSFRSRKLQVNWYWDNGYGHKESIADTLSQFSMGGDSEYSLSGSFNAHGKHFDF